LQREEIDMIDTEVLQLMPAQVGWYAVYLEKDETRLVPLACWAIVRYGGSRVNRAVGLVPDEAGGLFEAHLPDNFVALLGPGQKLTDERIDRHVAFTRNWLNHRAAVEKLQGRYSTFDPADVELAYCVLGEDYAAADRILDLATKLSVRPQDLARVRCADDGTVKH
jgi:hypothetical protein